MKKAISKKKIIRKEMHFIPYLTKKTRDSALNHAFNSLPKKFMQFTSILKIKIPVSLKAYPVQTS
jgi:hypothetical protein